MKTYPIIMGKGCPRILVRFQKAVFFPTIVSGILIQVLPDPAPSSVKSCAKFCFTLSLFQSKDSIFTFRNSQMIPISKQIINNKQKRAAQRVARFLRLWGSRFLCLCYALVYRLFAAHLQHNKKVDNVGLVPTNTY